MPKLASSLSCSGCSACAAICSRKAIMMVPDNEGFIRPVINANKCVECGTCEKSCHVMSPYQELRPINIYAARGVDNNIRFVSSSGGIFPLLAQSTIGKGGYVWGVRWDFNKRIPVAVHDFTDTISGLTAFRGSKYVQSYINNAYPIIKAQLQSGKEVLFSGTPCQIAGLRHYLRNDYANLLCCEVICHGVPSPKILHDYMATLLPPDDAGHEYVIKDIRFRDKLYENGGWRNGVVVVVVVDKYNGTETELVVSGKRADADPYLRGFLGELINRPSCHNCSARGLRSHADITLGDLWKVHKYAPEFDDNMGVSLVCINSPKGKKAFELIKSQLYGCKEIGWEDAIDSTGALISSPVAHRKRSLFFKRYSQNGFEAKLIAKLLRPTVKQRTQNYIRILKAKIRPYIKR